MAKIFSRDVLESINLGSEQGSNDNPDFFIKSTAWTELIRDQADLILGRKGAGKTKLFRQLLKTTHTIHESSGSTSQLKTTVVPLISSHLDDEFKNLLRAAGDDEELMKAGWLLQIAGLASVELLRSPVELREATTKEHEATKTLRKLLIKQREQGKFLEFFRTEIDELKRNMWEVVLEKISLAKSLRLRPTAAVDQSGEFKIYTDVYYANSEEDTDLRTTALSMIRSVNEVLTEREERFWIVVDSLDELLYGMQENHSNAAIRSLLRAIIDIRLTSNSSNFTATTCLSLKVFARDDVIARMTSDSPFPGLTTIQTSRITWSHREIAQMIKERIYSSEIARDFYTSLSYDNDPTKFVSQVFNFHGGNSFLVHLIKATSDSADHPSPRNIIGLLKRALAISKQEGHLGNAHSPTTPLITQSNYNMALNQTSLARLDDTIKAEYPHLSQLIDRLRGAPHTYLTLERMATQLDLDTKELDELLWWSDLAGLTEHQGLKIHVNAIYRNALQSTKSSAGGQKA